MRSTADSRAVAPGPAPASSRPSAAASSRSRRFALALARGACVGLPLAVVAQPAPAPREGGPVALRLAAPGLAGRPDDVKAAATLPDGDVAVTLLHSDTIEVDARGTRLAGRGLDTGVVVHDRRTGAARLAFSFGGDARRVVPHGLAVDADGAFVVVGYAGDVGPSRVDLGGGPVAFDAAEAPFVARFDATGRHLWSHVLHGRDGERPPGCAGTNCDRAWDLALAPDGRVVVVGGFSGRLRVPGGELRSAGGSDVFVMVLSREGAPLTSWTIGGPGAEGGRAGLPVAPGGLGEMSVAVSGGDVVVQGTFGVDAQFGGHGAPVSRSPANGVRDAFVARYGFDGRLRGEVWTAGARRDVATGLAAPGAMRADGDGRLFLSLRLPGGGAAWPGCAPLPPGGDRLVALSLDGTLGCRWASALEFRGGGVHRTVPDGRGSVYLAGWFTGRHAFPGREVVGRSTRSDVFVARLDADSGRPIWGAGLVAVDAVAAGNIPAGLAIDGDGHPWVGGQFFSTMDVAQPGQPPRLLDPVVPASAGGGSDALVVRLDAADGSLR